MTATPLERRAMAAHSAEASPELSCHRCGYDLRAHPPDGKCPECGTSVAESRQVAANPLRPAWRNSDPRWRRRMLAGAWVLVLLPLMDMLQATGWASRIPIPNVFGYGAVRTLDETLVCWPFGLNGWWGAYVPLVFCIGVVLLFSKERGRRRGKLDWTRRWGVICSYVVSLLSAAQFLFVPALALLGIAALFLSMPLKYQPRVTHLFVELSTGYLRYGPYPKAISGFVLVGFSSITMLLACVPLFDALRSSGRRRPAVILVASLALFTLMPLVQTLRILLGFQATRTFLGVSIPPSLHYELYFWPELLVGHLANLRFGLNLSGWELIEFLVEAAKWCIVLAIAIWLSIAQLAAWRHRRNIRATVRSRRSTA